MLQLNSQLMKISNFREDVLVEFIELSIEILSTETCSEVTCNNSIRIEHRNNIENK